MAQTQHQREHERIDIEMPTRMWLDENMKGKNVVFEGFAETANLAIGGTFLKCSYLLPIGYPINLEMQINDEEMLMARGEIIHRQERDELGMGVMFTAVDAENRERLLRFFISDRVREFFSERFVVEFPHLENVLSLKDVALIINLWEDKEGRLTSLRTSGGRERPQGHAQSLSRALSGGGGTQSAARAPRTSAGSKKKTKKKGR